MGFELSYGVFSLDLRPLSPFASGLGPELCSTAPSPADRPTGRVLLIRRRVLRQYHTWDEAHQQEGHI